MKEGIPILPPKGIAKERLDSIQQEIFQYCNLIEPRYIPMIEVLDYQNTGTHLLYLKCAPVDAGPYQTPVDAEASDDFIEKTFTGPVEIRDGFEKNHKAAIKSGDKKAAIKQKQ